MKRVFLPVGAAVLCFGTMGFRPPAVCAFADGAFRARLAFSTDKTTDDFEAIVAPLHRFLDEAPDRIPFTDWDWADTGRHRHSIARSVVGGVFLPMVCDLGRGK